MILKYLLNKQSNAKATVLDSSELLDSGLFCVTMYSNPFLLTIYEDNIIFYIRVKKNEFRFRV